MITRNNDHRTVAMRQTIPYRRVNIAWPRRVGTLCGHAGAATPCGHSVWAVAVVVVDVADGINPSRGADHIKRPTGFPL